MTMNTAARRALWIALSLALGACSDEYFPEAQNSADMPAGVDMPPREDIAPGADIPEDVDMPPDVDMPSGMDMDPGMDMPPGDPCQGVSCGANGRCAPVAGAATCVCDMGFVPQGLSCVVAPMEATIVVNVTGAATTTETGDKATLTIQLSRQPTHAVTVPVKVSRPDLATANLSEVLFIPASWNMPQTVTITGKDDGVMNGQQTYFVLLGPATSQDAGFSGLEASATLTSQDVRCGDGVKTGAEQCDEPGASQQCAYGQSSCTVCTPQCTLVAGQPGQRCGDGVKNGPEQCDVPGASQRCAYGQSSCMVCDAQCALVAGQPGERCGDGVVQAAQGEQCDGAAMCPAGVGGLATCDASCRLDSSGCTTTAEAIWIGQDHTCVITSGDALVCWGDNTNQLLNPSSSAATITTPTAYPGLPSGLASVALGEAHMCVETAPGGVKCWGSNTHGQLGDGSLTSRTAPSDVPGLSGIRILSAGGSSSCVVNSVGGAMCWGDNSGGQLGVGLSFDQLLPTDVVGLTSGVSFVEPGRSHGCARMSSGGIKCWGTNSSGQLGDATTTARATPVDVFGLTSGTRFITVGSTFTCVITSLGTAKCWGSNANGQLGDGTTLNRNVPTDVLNLSDVKSLTTGNAHVCALTNAGGVKCWGSNTFGQLGDGTTTRSTTPVDVVGLTSGVRSIRAGANHVCALRTTGELRCWGRNNRAQLGDASGGIKTTPSAIPGIR